jgi:uncharacterized membrane protein
MFVDRGRRGPGANLAWRVRLLGLGAVLAMVGISTEREWLVNVALGVLILGFGLRFVGARNGAGEADDDQEPELGDGVGDAPPEGSGEGPEVKPRDG